MTKKLLLLKLTSLLLVSEIKSQVKFEFSIFTFHSLTEISIKTTLTNTSNRIQTVPRNRTFDYVEHTSLPVGTYIIEFQKWQDGTYKLIPISADIDPIHYGGQLDTLKKGKSVSDTLQISSRHFGTQGQPGFSKGRYRLRMAFNQNGKRNKKAMFSKWQEIIVD